MKKLLLLSLAVSVGVTAYSQSRMAPGVHLVPVPKAAVMTAKAQVATEKTFTPPVREQAVVHATHPSNYVERSSSTLNEQLIGSTWYDNQSNRGTAKRISNNGDGTLSAVATFSPAGVIGTWADRRSGYTYYDGTNWSPMAAVEVPRVGFTNIDYTSQAGEYVCAHTGAAGLMVSYRATKGTGAWSNDTAGTFNLFPSQADVWSRMALGGSDGRSVHVIVNSQGTGTTPVLNQMGPLTYTRSTDGGVTWDKDHIQLPGDDAANYWGVGAEEYHIDARGTTVAIVEGGFAHDVVLYKSTDNGDNWTKTVIKAFPIPLYDDATMITDVDGDAVADTIESNAGDVTVTIDNNNMCHIAYGMMHVLEDDPTAGLSYFPSDDGLMYWNESMGAGTSGVMVAAAEDFNGNGTLDIPIPTNTANPYGIYNVGLTCMPSIGIDAGNRIFITYATIDERTDTTVYGQILRHVFVIGSPDGVNWSMPVCAVADPAGAGAFYECVWPSAATLVDNDIHIVYQRDGAPGTTLSGDAQAVTNNSSAPSDIVYARLSASDVLAVQEHQVVNNDLVSALYPNPASAVANVELNLTKTSDVKLEITNMVGQVVIAEKYNALNAGKQTVKLNVSHLKRGVYFCNVSTDTEKVSRKLTIE